MDEDSHEVTPRRRRSIALTATEFELLRFLMRNPRRVLSKAQILDRVWNYDFGGQANVVELYISYLRKKIDAGREPMIHTMRGAGYVLKPGRLSGRPTGAAARAGRLGRRCWSALLAVACLGVVTAVVSVVALRQLLVDQLDQQLVTAADRRDGYGADRGRRRPQPTPAGPTRRDHGRHPAGCSPGGQGRRHARRARSSGGTVDAGIVDSAGDGPRSCTDAATQAAARAAGRRPAAHASTSAGPRATTGVVASRTAATARRHHRTAAARRRTTPSTAWRVDHRPGALAGAAARAAFARPALIVRRTLRPLRRVAATADRVAELPLDRGEVALAVRVPARDTDPRTEVGQVGAALNRHARPRRQRALTARQASETRVRQFVADASHELRTPLAAIRGLRRAHPPRRDEPAARRRRTRWAGSSPRRSG